jgi:hypothetical protein
MEVGFVKARNKTPDHGDLIVHPVAEETRSEHNASATGSQELDVKMDDYSDLYRNPEPSPRLGIPADRRQQTRALMDTEQGAQAVVKFVQKYEAAERGASFRSRAKRLIGHIAVVGLGRPSSGQQSSRRRTTPRLGMANV